MRMLGQSLLSKLASLQWSNLSLGDTTQRR
jgi:hypothetical protein